jgi:hypothetical protein
MQFFGSCDALVRDDQIGSLGLSKKEWVSIQWKARKKIMSNARKLTITIKANG